MQGLLQQPAVFAAPHFPVQLSTTSTSFQCRRRRRRTGIRALNLLTEISQIAADAATDGPIELPSEIIQQDDDQPLSPLRIVGGFALTGAIVFLLLRSLQRRLKDAREKKPEKPLKEQANKAIAELSGIEVKVDKPPPSVVETLIGALIGGAIAFVLYQMTMAVDDTLASKPLPTETTTRNIAVTIRTIIRGICYLATCVYGGNSVGLLLYAVQLITDPPAESKLENQPDKGPGATSSDRSSSD